jgi:tetratricopeptide (TPR) repeat protein
MEQMNTPFSQIVASCKSKSEDEEAKTFLKTASNNLFDIGLLDHVAQLQSSIKDYNETIETLKRMLKLTNEEPASNAIRSNLATTYNKVNNPQAALEQLNQLPNDVSIKMEKSLAHYFLAEYGKAETIMREIAAISNLPENIKDRIDYNLAIYEIEKGNFKKGYWQYIEKGHRIHIWPTQNRAMIPQWKGEIEPGKTIAIHAEGGIGDELIGVRFMQKIKDLGMRPIWRTNNQHIHEVFNRNGYECVFDFSEIDSFDIAQVMAMYLPIYLNLDKDDLWFGSYLKPSEEYLKKWEQLLPAGKKIACKWQGNMHYDQDLHRSIPIDKIKELEYDGTKINLQLEPELKNDWSFSPDINSIEDTLAILWLCDDVISSCTSVAHMAGAMGKEVTVCPPIAYYYVWANGINWYGNHVTVRKQSVHNSWEEVFEEIRYAK